MKNTVPIPGLVHVGELCAWAIRQDIEELNVNDFF